MLDNIITGIKNIVTWFPVIWKDRQWDYVYLLKILDKKLGLMLKDFEENPNVNLNEEITEIRIAQLHLQCLIKESDWQIREEELKDLTTQLNNHLLGWWS